MIFALVVLAGCATPAEVADNCEREVRASRATGVSGEFTMGVASDSDSNARFVSDSDIALSAGVDLGGGGRADPRSAYEDCVRARSGQGPVRPYGAS